MLPRLSDNNAGMRHNHVGLAHPLQLADYHLECGFGRAATGDHRQVLREVKPPHGKSSFDPKSLLLFSHNSSPIQDISYFLLCCCIVIFLYRRQQYISMDLKSARIRHGELVAAYECCPRPPTVLECTYLDVPEVNERV